MSIAKLDGITGQSYPAYTVQSPSNFDSLMAVHPDGTVFAIEYDRGDSGSPGKEVVGINPASGAQKFSITLGQQPESPACPGGPPVSYSVADSVLGMIIAGDGYAYVAYQLDDWAHSCSFTNLSTAHLQLLRVNTAGASNTLDLKDWSPEEENFSAWYAARFSANLITNADSGTLIGWKLSAVEVPMIAARGEQSARKNRARSTAPGSLDYLPNPLSPPQFGMAVTAGAGASEVSGPDIPSQASAVAPVLQAQDGSFVGIVGVQQADYSTQQQMIAFDASGNIHWVVSGNWQPQIATADGGVIASQLDSYGNPIATITFDQNGNATGQAGSLPTYSWTGNAYQQQGSVEQISADLLFVLYDVASSFWAVADGNYSDNATGYALIRTFSDNDVSSDVTVSNFSQTGANQQTITNVLNDVLQGLNSDNYASCTTWLTGASPISISTTISNLTTYNAYGHGQFSENETAAFVGTRNQDGTPTGVPGGVAITVNDKGAFFNAKLDDKTFTVGRRAYTGGALKAQAAILIHELGHLMNESGGAAGFQSDAGNKQAGRANDKLVDQYCGRLIGGLR